MLPGVLKNLAENFNELLEVGKCLNISAIRS